MLTGLSPAQAETFTGRVVGVVDGDTITVLDTDHTQHKVRLTGIDAPERKQAFGTKAKQHLASLVSGRTVTVEWFKRDRYQRILGKVMRDGQDVNLEQIRAGFAWHGYQRDQLPADRPVYAEAAEASRLNGFGLWTDTRPIPPWDYRRK
ncbi:Endonuclease YncB, thermonuclease family [Nitrosospira sp. Nsp13]|nr:Endonuclease YncB, thermonuclease family [Nitrosospira sp. Nsp13]